MAYSRLTTNATTTIRTGKGLLRKVIVNSPGATGNTLTLYDNTAGSGNVIGVINTTGLTGAIPYDLPFFVGLTATMGTGTAADVTIDWDAVGGS